MQVLRIAQDDSVKRWPLARYAVRRRFTRRSMALIQSRIVELTQCGGLASRRNFDFEEIVHASASND